MSKKYIARMACEMHGHLYTEGSTILVENDVELYFPWQLESEYLEEQEAERKIEVEADSMTKEEQKSKIKDLSKKLKLAEKQISEKQNKEKTDAK